MLIAECKQEISSFNPVDSTYDYFTVNYGAELLAYHDGKGTEVRGALDAFKADSDIETDLYTEPVPTRQVPSPKRVLNALPPNFHTH